MMGKTIIHTCKATAKKACRGVTFKVIETQINEHDCK